MRLRRPFYIVAIVAIVWKNGGQPAASAVQGRPGTSAHAGAQARDIVKLAGKPPFAQVRLTGFSDGEICFRGVSGYVIRKRLAEVEYLRIEGAEALDHAEASAASGAWCDGWLADLAAARRIRALDCAGRFDEAVVEWLEALRGRRFPAEAVIPRRPGPPGSEVNARALGRLRGARLSDASGAAIRRLYLETLIHEDVAALPREFAAASAAQSASAPSPDAPPLIFGERRSAPDRAALISPGSFLYDSARRAEEQGALERAERIIGRALSFCEAPPHAWQVLRARCWLARGSPEAEAALRELAADVEDRAVRAEARYYLAVAQERAGRRDAARELYREVADSPDLDQALRAPVREALTRLGDAP
jgi:tetratricopeptide (TPR) repeat protein